MLQVLHDFNDVLRQFIINGIGGLGAIIFFPVNLTIDCIMHLFMILSEWLEFITHGIQRLYELLDQLYERFFGRRPGGRGPTDSPGTGSPGTGGGGPGGGDSNGGGGSGSGQSGFTMDSAAVAGLAAIFPGTAPSSPVISASKGTADQTLSTIVDNADLLVVSVPFEENVTIYLCLIKVVWFLLVPLAAPVALQCV
jgi:hypothetical protein